jgi:hypothetical protein
MRSIPKRAAAGLLALAAGAATFVPGAHAACCYFSAKDKDVTQPAQKAFITFDPQTKTETFTVQPKFEGNAPDFGMVIPTPARPKLDTMPREFFKELAVFTLLEPMDTTNYKQPRMPSAAAARADGPPTSRPRVRVLEAGVVGSLEYKIVEAKDAKDLFQWLKDNDYSYSGDEETLDFYVKKGWYFTTMKIDPTQMKKRPDGTYEGEVTPTRFTFASEKLVYPLRITRISVKDTTEALFYVQAPKKMDLPGDFSHQPSFLTMWSQATSFADPEKLTAEEKAWQQAVREPLQKMSRQLVQSQRQPTSLEWAKKITADDVKVMTGEKKFNREAPAEDVEKLKQLKGIVKEGQWVTKMRKVFAKGEMTDDLEFVEAKIGDKPDDIEYFRILPTSPP